MGCVPYTPDYTCCDEWGDYDPALRERATALAWASLRHLTAGRIGQCPVLLRPCRQGCAGASDSVLSPDYRDGKWYNTVCSACGRTGCSCGPICEVILPSEVAAIGAVFLDGAELDPSAYRIDNGAWLVRQDGDCWPICQDMSQPWDGLGAFSVVYQPGVWPGKDGLWAAGILACEFAKACSGGKCRLPAGVTSLSRQGVSMEFREGMFDGGITGIREVDAYVAGINPNHLLVAPKVWSPDLAASRGRVTTGMKQWPSSVPTQIGPFSWHFAARFDRVATP